MNSTDFERMIGYTVFLPTSSKDICLEMLGYIKRMEADYARLNDAYKKVWAQLMEART